MHNATIAVGDATATLIDCGLIQVELGEWLPIPTAERPAEYAAAFAQPIALPILCVLIQLPNRNLMVDACHPALVPLAFDVPSGSTPAPSLVAQLAACGLTPEDVSDVVITHAHTDHVSGLTRLDLDSTAPTFPNARHYLGRADWEELQPHLAQPDSLESRTVGAIHAQGLLELVAGPRDLGDGLALVPAPGETPGHQILRLTRGGATLYCLGDLFHHELEVAHPAHVVAWANAEVKRHSRAELLPALRAADVVLATGHIPGFGRLRRIHAETVVWERV